MEYTEIWWNVVSVVFRMVYIVSTASCFSCLIKPFLKKRGAVKIGVTYFGVMMFLNFVPYEMENFLAYSIGTCAAFVVMCVIDRRNYEQKLFLAVTFYALRALSAVLVNILDNVVSERIYIKIASASLGVNFWVYFVVTVVYAVMQYAVIRFVVLLVLHVYKRKQQNLTRKETVMLIMPSLVAVAGNEVRKNYEAILKDTFRYGSDPSVGWEALYGVFSIVTILVIITLFQKIKEEGQEKWQNEMLAIQIEHMREHIAQVENLYQDIRSLKHDMANHVVILDRLCEQGESEAAKSYTDYLKEQYFNTAGILQTGHPVTDVIVREKIREAEEKEIYFSCDFHYPQGTNVNAFDVSVILSNGLQNAFEAVVQEKTRTVSLCSYWKNNAYMIEITNNFTGILYRNDENGLPVTTKQAVGEQEHGLPATEKQVVGEQEHGLPATKKQTIREHGYGLPNIQRVAQKYYGDIDVTQEEGKFRLTVMLMICPVVT